MIDNLLTVVSALWYYFAIGYAVIVAVLWLEGVR